MDSVYLYLQAGSNISCKQVISLLASFHFNWQGFQNCSQPLLQKAFVGAAEDRL